MRKKHLKRMLFVETLLKHLFFVINPIARCDVPVFLRDLLLANIDK